MNAVKTMTRTAEATVVAVLLMIAGIVSVSPAAASSEADGYVEAVGVYYPYTVQVDGWLYPDTACIAIWVDGSRQGDCWPLNVHRPDVNKALGTSGDLGFSDSFTDYRLGDHMICVLAVINRVMSFMKGETCNKFRIDPWT